MPDLSKAPTRIAGMFDAIAGRYDFLNHLLSAGIDRRWRKRAIQALSLAGGERVLAPGGRIAILEFAIPATPGVRALYLWYFNQVLPLIGRLISRHAAAYGYLPASVGAFASPEEFVTILREHGFVDVAAARLTFGIVFLYTARRG